MKKANILDGMIKFQTDRLLDKQKFNWENEAVNIVEELFEAKGYDIPKDKRDILKEKFIKFVENIVNDLNLTKKEITSEDELDAFCDIAEFSVGAILKLGYDPYCALNEMQKHINSRTGKIINGKFVKDTNIKTFKPNYKKCKRNNCEKRIRFSYNPKIFEMLKDKKRRIGGNYPVGGEIIAKIDEELIKALEEYYDVSDVEIGDCIVMDNGWSVE